MALEFTYWLPPSAVKQSGKTRIAGPILLSWTSRAARSGTLSLKLFHATCARPEPVNPTRSNSTGKRRPRPRPAAASYWGGSQSASLRTCGSPRGLSLSTLEACSSGTTVPGFQRGRFSAILRRGGGSLYELMLHRVVHQLRIGGQTELLQDAYPVGADRARAQQHLFRDLVDRLARSEQPHHPILAVGKRLVRRLLGVGRDRKSTRLNSSHLVISYAVFCLKKKNV